MKNILIQNFIRKAKLGQNSFSSALWLNSREIYLQKENVIYDEKSN